MLSYPPPTPSAEVPAALAVSVTQRAAASACLRMAALREDAERQLLSLQLLPPPQERLSSLPASLRESLFGVFVCLCLRHIEEYDTSCSLGAAAAYKAVPGRVGARTNGRLSLSCYSFSFFCAFLAPFSRIVLLPQRVCN